jgi:hypothetical protein
VKTYHSPNCRAKASAARVTDAVGRFFHYKATGKYYYKYLWWGHKINEVEHDYFAMGVLGQHIFVSPSVW